jgi:phosphate transport system protein
MWRMAADAYADRDAEVAVRLNERDDEVDELHVSLTAELVSGQLTMPVALEMALVGRFYERLGDHAVNIGERIRYIAEGM